jgi:cytochrome b pre-mRNA-processing protein 3
MTLHACLVIRRLSDLPPKGSAFGQELTDAIFSHFDRALREMGVGDTTVPKRMKTLAEAFLGRSSAYDLALKSGEESSMQEALARNIYRGGRTAERLSHYALAVEQALAAAPIEAFTKGPVPFPRPSSIQ